MSQQVPAEGAGRMEGQWKGSAVVLNDCMGLNLLGQGRIGSGWLSDSEANVRAGELSGVGVKSCNYYARCTSLCASHVHKLLPVYHFGVLVFSILVHINDDIKF